MTDRTTDAIVTEAGNRALSGGPPTFADLQRIVREVEAEAAQHALDEVRLAQTIFDTSDNARKWTDLSEESRSVRVEWAGRIANEYRALQDRGADREDVSNEDDE